MCVSVYCLCFYSESPYNVHYDAPHKGDERDCVAFLYNNKYIFCFVIFLSGFIFFALNNGIAKANIPTTQNRQDLYVCTFGWHVAYIAL